MSEPVPGRRVLPAVLAAVLAVLPADAVARPTPAVLMGPGMVPDTAAPVVPAQAGVPVEAAQFLQAAVEASLAEVSLSQLAMERAANPQVRSFASEIIQAHSAAQQRLAALAFGLGVPVPNAMDEAHAALYSQMQQIGGAAFDQQYVQGQIAIHQITVRLYTEAAGRAGDDVGAFAAEMLPVLQQHLGTAEGLAQSLM